MPFVTDAMFDHIGLIETHQVAVEYKQLETVMTAKTHTLVLISQKLAEY